MILLPLPFTPPSPGITGTRDHTQLLYGWWGCELKLDAFITSTLLPSEQAHQFKRVFPFDGPHGLSIHQLQTSFLSSNKHPSRFLLEFLSWLPVTTASVGVAGRCSRSHGMTGNLIGKQPRPLSIQDRFLATGSSPPASTI